jgi:hypothetical protein
VITPHPDFPKEETLRTRKLFQIKDVTPATTILKKCYLDLQKLGTKSEKLNWKGGTVRELPTCHTVGTCQAQLDDDGSIARHGEFAAW